MAKTFKKLTALFLTALMVFGLFSVVPATAFGTANCTIIAPTNLTDDGKTENGTLWNTKEKNLHVNSKYAGTQVQVDNIWHDTIADLGKNLVDTVKWGTTVETLGTIGVDRTNLVKDGKFLQTTGSNWIDVTSALQSSAWTVPTSDLNGQSRFGTNVYDGVLVADLGSTTTIDTIYAMLHYQTSYAWRTYKI